jgi:hypothetical protein
MDDRMREPFTTRFGLAAGPMTDRDFPETARIGLWHVLNSAVRSDVTRGWAEIANELLRLRRVRYEYEADTASDVVFSELMKLNWEHVYEFCERVYSRLLRADVYEGYQGSFEVITGLEDARQAYESDINQLFGEENIAYRMAGGELYRPGRAHSQRVAVAAQKVLQDPRLHSARVHFSKAQKFFEKPIEPDFPNAIKEAVAALEAATKALFPTTPADLEKALRQIRDANDQPIPPTIVKGVLSTYHFRGAGEGVAHGSGEGGRPTAALAEWILTTAAASIIYLRDIALEIEDEEPPF